MVSTFLLNDRIVFIYIFNFDNVKHTRSNEQPETNMEGVMRSSLVNFQCCGVLLIWIIVGHGPNALAVDAGEVVWTFFSRLSFLFTFSLSGSGSV